MTSVNIQTQNSDIINYFNKELSKHPSDIIIFQNWFHLLY